MLKTSVSEKLVHFTEQVLQKHYTCLIIYDKTVILIYDRTVCCIIIHHKAGNNITMFDRTVSYIIIYD